MKFSSYQEANSAIQAINGTDWNGSKMAVRMADAGRSMACVLVVDALGSLVMDTPVTHC